MGPRFNGPAASGPNALRGKTARLDSPSCRQAITPLGGRGLGSEADVDPEFWTLLHPGMTRFVTWSEQSAELLVELWHVAERVQFPVDASESSGGLGVFSEPAAAILLQLTELLYAVVHLVDLVVEPRLLGHDNIVVGPLGLNLSVGPLLGVMPPVATRPAAVGCLGEAFGFPAAVQSGVEVPSGLALGGIGVAAPAGSEVASRPLEAGEADLGGSEFFGPVRRDRGLGRLSLNLEAGEAEGFSDRRGGGLAAFDIEGFGGGGAGVDGPAGPTIHGPLPSQVFDGLVEVVGDDVDGVGLAGPADGDVGE
jgi:hypothetical protein